MEKLINRQFITIIFILFSFSLNAQNKTCVTLSENVCKKKFAKGDTIEFAVKSLINDTIHYHLEVMMHNGKDWIYSPYYTKYFNFQLSYSKMIKMFSSKLPITFSPDYKDQSKILIPHEISKFQFVVDKPEKYKKMIRFRINSVEECGFIYSNSFYFVRIKE